MQNTMVGDLDNTDWHQVSIAAFSDGRTIFRVTQSGNMVYEREIQDDQFTEGPLKFFAGCRNNHFRNVMVAIPPIAEEE